MKTKITWIALALAAAGTFAANAQEDDKAGPRGGRGPRQFGPAVIKEFDKDGDGKLNDEERKAAGEAFQAKREEARKKELAEFDKDKDGKLNDEEQKAANEARETKRKALVEKYDADKDGKLSREEIATAVKADEDLSVLRPGGPGGPRGGRGEGAGRPPRGEGKDKPAPPAEKPAGE